VATGARRAGQQDAPGSQRYGDRAKATSRPFGRQSPINTPRYPRYNRPGAHGPPRHDTAAFVLVLADGLDPPFADASFDTVLTPWFIDQVPDDVRLLTGAIHRVLKPSGCWVNHGPLLLSRQHWCAPVLTC
jgi:Methyltransferase domain